MKKGSLTSKPTPCMGCGDRFVGCHDRCERYAQYRAKMDAQIEIRKREIEILAYAVDRLKKYR